MTTYGEGIGRVYTKEVPSSISNTTDRREEILTTVVGKEKVTIIIRDTIVPEDPYLNLVRASAYTWYTRKTEGRAVFPVPPVGREIKDFLIKSNIII
jgi:2',3'-cyclic-nucleotide 2'-phosphodiesterase (5'-nucleotidase family)